MSLNFFEKIKIRLKFSKFFKRKNLWSFPLNFYEFERWIVFFPDKEIDAMEVLPFIYGLKNKYNSNFIFFIPEKVHPFMKEIGKCFFYKNIDFKTLYFLNSEIVNHKSIIIDFLMGVEFKKYVVRKCLWISKDNYGDVLIKGGFGEFGKFFGINEKD